MIILLSQAGIELADDGTVGEKPMPRTLSLYIIWWFVSASPWFALQARRFHDQGRSGWWTVINAAAYPAFIASPPVGLLLFLVSLGLMAFPGRAEGRESSEHAATPVRRTRQLEGPLEGEAATADPFRPDPLLVAQLGPAAPLVPKSEMASSSAMRIIVGLEGAAIGPEGAGAAAGGARAADDDPDVEPLDGGRFSSGGYIFSTYDQAQRYAMRRREARRPALYQAPPPQARSVPAPPPASGQRDKGGVWDNLFGQPRDQPKQTAQWISGPAALTIGDLVLDAHLLYYGSPRRYDERHRALVDPALPVGRHSDREGISLGYWPSYSELRPEARRAYLEWLAGGRCEPSTPIGYVFIYFYGLERRLLAESAGADAPAIIGEVARLLAIYGQNHSFSRYARALLEAAELVYGLATPMIEARADMRLGWEIPLSVRLALGRKVRDGIPIDANDALCWALCHPQLSTRTAVRRCFDAFRDLWHHHFNERYPNGIKVRKSQSRLRFDYRSASAEFHMPLKVDDIPDIGAVSGPFSALSSLLDQCTAELDPLSRFIGRNPHEADTLLAAALVPAAIRGSYGSRFADTKIAIERLLDDKGFGELTVRDLVGQFMGGSEDGDLRKTVHRRLPDLLAALGMGFEPDRRFGPAVTLGEETRLCIFILEDPGKTSVGAAYETARTMVEISILAAQSDKLVVEAELYSIAMDIAAVAELDQDEKRRLEGHMRALLHNPPKLGAAKKRLLALGEDEKDVILQSVIRAVLADQRVTPPEVRYLEQLYKLLGKPQDEIYGRLHAGADIGAAPARKRSEGIAGLDGAKLARIREETSAVSTMLAGIFQEEEDAESPAPAPAEASPLPGLDAAHSRLLVSLTREPLETDAFEAMCKSEKLLVEGAVETINDWAYDQFGDAVVELDDLVCIVPDYIVQITNMSRGS